MTKLVQISSPGFSTTLRECHVGCRLGQVFNFVKCESKYLEIYTHSLSSKNKFSKMPAYLKVVDKYTADYTFGRFRGLSNGLHSPVEGSQEPPFKTSVSLESFNASF